MKHLSIIGLLCLLFIFTLLINAKSEETTKIWINAGSAGTVYLRSEPSKESEELAEIKNGETFEVTDIVIKEDKNSKSNRKWIQITYNEKIGYVAIWLVSFEEPCNESAKIIKGKGAIRIRDIPEGDVIATLQPGTKVKAVASIPGWTKIRYGSRQKAAWIMTEFLVRNLEVLENEDQ